MGMGVALESNATPIPMPVGLWIFQRSSSRVWSMLVVGLTGNIASGKSTVAEMFAARGATIIDADLLARRAVRVGTAGHRAIVERWGEEVLLPDGALDRAALRQRVFPEPDELDALNAIVHPEVARLRDEELAAARAR